MAITVDDYQVQVELASQSNIAADSVVNTFAVSAASGASVFADITTNVDAFYASLGSYLAPTLLNTTDAHKVRVYHLSEPEPRPPVYIGSFTQAGTPVALPAEVAVCSSFSAAAPAGTLPARRRGRIYVGPLNDDTGSVVGSYLRPSPTFRALLAASTKALVEGLADDGWIFSVWSRRDNTLFPVVRGWVNDEYDTQRRRGPEVTTRDTWAL